MATAFWLVLSALLAIVPTTVATAQAATTETVEVRVWQSTRDAVRLYVSARPAGGSWADLGTVPVSLSGLSEQGAYRYGDITVGAGVEGAAPAPVEVRVWQSVIERGDLRVSARPAGGDWSALDPVPLELSALSSGGRWRYGDVTLEVPAPTDPESSPRESSVEYADLERRALTALYHATDGPNWANSADWLTDAPVGDWYGVTVGNDGRVTRLTIARNELSGELPSELSDLANLTRLNIAGNELSGELPSELGDLANLTTLNIARNELSGQLPLELSRLANLEVLAFANDTGLCAPTDDAFQTWLGRIDFVLGSSCATASAVDRAALIALYEATGGTGWSQSANWLSDRPLRVWAGVTIDAGGRVVRLDLNSNRLSGAIPPELGKLANLEVLWLGSNRLSGEIPPQLGNLVKLTDLRLHANGLSGTIPPELGKLANLTALRLYDNELTGRIPPELGKLANLETIRLENNKLSGPIPPELGDLAQLRWLTLGYNPLSGPIPAALGGLSKLSTLRLNFTDLNGRIPRELTQLANLTELRLDNTRLSGPIPPGLGDFTKLETLWLGDSPLTGRIPQGLGNLSNLNWLSIGGTEISGPIPPELGNLSNLTWLSLHVNELTGHIPAELGKLAKLTHIGLHGNNLTGSIPPELANPPNLVRLWLQDNRLSGTIPTELGNLNDLRELWLRDNQLNGEIPRELIDSANEGKLWLRTDLLNRGLPDSDVPVRVTPSTRIPHPSVESIAVELSEAFSGRRFEQPVEIGAYPVGPGDGLSPGLFVAELDGRILLLYPDSDEAVELLNIGDRVSRERSHDGLLSVALDPLFDQNGHLWVFYSTTSALHRTQLSRFTADPNDPRLVDHNSELVILEIDQPDRHHNGGAIRFGPDGMLYLGLGDGSPGRDPQRHGQNLGSLLGSIIRIDIREASAGSPYVVPPDNPFVDTSGARPEIWAYGFRNPWRMAFDPMGGALWAGDVGEHDVEEVNLIEAGGNYGWNRLEGTLCFVPLIGCDPEDTVPPVAQYNHNLGCAVTGGVVYRGEAVPALAGHYLFSDICGGQLWALPPGGGDVVELAVSPRQISSFGIDAHGEMYVLTTRGAVLHIVPPQQ